MPYVGGSLALSRRYMSSAELSSLVQSPRHVNQRHVCYTPLPLPVCECTRYVPHLLRDLLHDVVCDDVSVADTLPVAVVVVS